MCKTPTYYLILNSLAFARGCVILQLTHSLSSFAHFAYISSYLTLIILSEVLLLLSDYCVRILQPFLVDVDR